MSATGRVPIGHVVEISASSMEDDILWIQSIVENGWHELDGFVLHKDAYPELFAVIGYTYGGEGEWFSLPRLDNCVIKVR